MSETVLLIFEGAKTEPQVLKSIRRSFFRDDTNTIFVASYGTNIYNLWKNIKGDTDLDLIELLKEKSTCDHKNANLENLSRDKISQTFLFFDYDGHDTSASDDDLEKMLDFFSEETEAGKLYISYPMAEAIRDFNLIGIQEFSRCRIKAKENVKYKALVGERAKHFQINKLSISNWKAICKHALSKGNCLFNDTYKYPEKDVFYNMHQANIFKKQLEKHILPDQMVAILSSFPFFIVEYLGFDNYQSFLKTEL